MTKKSLAFLLSLCMLLTLSAPFAGAEALAADQTLNMSFVYPLTLDVNDARNANEFQIMTHVFEGLVRIMPNEEGVDVYEPAGAESWDISEDGTVWTFNLREHYWSDGVQVTAQQYVDSVLRLLNPERAFAYAFFAFDIAGAEAYYLGEGAIEDIGIKAIDDTTLEITLGESAPYFSKKLGFAVMFPIRTDLIEAGGDTYATDPSKHAYNGPFTVSAWVQDNSMTLSRNESYWDAENVKLETVNFTVVDEFSTRATLFEAGQLDVIEGNSDYAEKWISMAETGAFQYFQGKYPSTSLVAFNNKTGGPSGIMLNEKVRLAFSLAMDREGLLDIVYHRYYPAYGYIPYGINSGDQEYRALKAEPLKALADEYGKDKEKLQALLQEGLAELGMDTDLSKISVILLTSTSGGTVASAAAEFIQQTWQINLGVTVELHAYEVAIFREERNSHNYEFSLMGWTGDYDDPLTFIDLFLSTSEFLQYFGWYSSPEYDAAAASLKGVADAAERADIYEQIETIAIVEQAGFAPYYYSDTMNFVQNDVQNFKMPAFGPQYEFSRAYITE